MKNSHQRMRCQLPHMRSVYAVGLHRDIPLCRRHLNRVLQDDRIALYIETEGPRCPDHPSVKPQCTRWRGQRIPQLFCPTGIGDPIMTKGSGRGAFRMGARKTYLDWCPWQADIPADILQAGLPDADADADRDTKCFGI